MSKVIVLTVVCCLIGGCCEDCAEENFLCDPDYIRGSLCCPPLECVSFPSYNGTGTCNQLGELVAYDASQKVYDEDFVKNTAFYASKIAYCEQQDIISWNCPSCQYLPNIQDSQVFYNGSHELQSYCGYDPDSDSIIFSYRGSKDINNFIADLQLDMINYESCSGCKVHRGFFRTYEDSIDSMFGCYKKLKQNSPNAKIIVTGHSLGASVSQLLAVDLYKKYNENNIHLIAFASPRVGNQAYASYINTISPNMWRIVHNKDLFAHYPSDLLGYKHMGTEVWYDEDSTSYQICYDQEQKDCSHKINIIFGSIPDHKTLFGQFTNCTIGSKNQYGEIWGLEDENPYGTQSQDGPRQSGEVLGPHAEDPLKPQDGPEVFVV